MKRLILAALLSAVILVPVYAAEIYWDTPPGDAEITDKDFKYEFQGITPAKSFRERDVYFNPGDPVPDWATDLVEPVRPEAAPAQPRVVDTPRPSVTTTPVPESARRAPAVSPQPAETSPGNTQSILPPSSSVTPAETKKPQSKRSQRSSSTGEPADKPSSKKLRWGQGDAKPSDEKGKFQWGQQK